MSLSDLKNWNDNRLKDRIGPVSDDLEQRIIDLEKRIKHLEQSKDYDLYHTPEKQE